MELKTIHFSELSNYNDSNSIVFTGLLLNNEDIEDVCNFPNEIKLAPVEKKVTGIYKILDNVMGEDGRTDWLITFDRPDLQFSPIARLNYGDWIKWTSDFINNFEEDYITY